MTADKSKFKFWGKNYIRAIEIAEFVLPNLSYEERSAALKLYREEFPNHEHRLRRDGYRGYYIHIDDVEIAEDFLRKPETAQRAKEKLAMGIGYGAGRRSAGHGSAEPLAITIRGKKILLTKNTLSFFEGWIENLLAGYEKKTGNPAPIMRVVSNNKPLLGSTTNSKPAQTQKPKIRPPKNAVWKLVGEVQYIRTREVFDEFLPPKCSSNSSEYHRVYNAAYNAKWFGCDHKMISGRGVMPGVYIAATQIDHFRESLAEKLRSISKPDRPVVGRNKIKRAA